MKRFVILLTLYVSMTSFALAETRYKTLSVDGLDVFYREAGDPSKPTLVLLHGFPSSSHMFEGLIAELEDSFYLVAPDYPGFGNSSSPSPSDFSYTFDNLAVLMEHFLAALNLDRYNLYLHDYGGPVGFRLALAHPERIEGLVIQSAVAYVEGIEPIFLEPVKALAAKRDATTEAAAIKFFTLDTTRFQHLEGVSNPETINPEVWTSDQDILDRPGNQAIQLELFTDYNNNLTTYPDIQAYFREYQPPTLIVWGQGDPIFAPEAALAYRKDLPKAEVHLINSSHFALDDRPELIALIIREFFERNVAVPQGPM
jgi:pimeloyl-ACP methyl ester carboxylesterase